MNVLRILICFLSVFVGGYVFGETTHISPRGLAEKLFRRSPLGKKSASEYMELGDARRKNDKSKEALDAYLNACKLEYGPAYEIVADYYFGLWGNEKDLPQAVKYYLKAHGVGAVTSTYKLANCYDQGVGVKQNFQKALELYHTAAEKKHLQAALKYIEYCKNGRGMNSMNIAEARKWENTDFVKKYLEEEQRREEQRREEQRRKIVKAARKAYLNEKYEDALGLYKQLVSTDESMLEPQDEYYYAMILSGEKGGEHAERELAKKWMKRASAHGHKEATVYYKKYFE